jgi:transcriptional regulator with XRE-family HTH domain
MAAERFGEELKDVLREREMSQRDLAKLTRRKHDWGSPATIARICDGTLPPTMHAMEVIARSLNMAPSKFSEYQLAKARRSLDPGAVGIKRAWRNLQGH